MLTPAHAHAYAGGTAPGVIPGTVPPEQQSQELPAGPGTEFQFKPSPAVIIGLSAEAKGQLDRWFGPEAEKDDGILPEEVYEAGDDPFHLAEDGTIHQAEEAEDTNKALSTDEQEVVREMTARDAEVRAHENAHVTAGGGLASAPTFSYQVGPDGKRYAIGGSVKISLSPGSTPEETLSKAERVRAAALAPSEPSPQDVSVASSASQMAAEARTQIAEEKNSEAQKEGEERIKSKESPWSIAAAEPDSIPEPGSLRSALA